MSRVINSYRKALKRDLRCPFWVKKQFLVQFDKMIQPLLEEMGTPSYTDLVQAFGSSSTLAVSMLNEVPPEQQERWKLYKKFFIALGIVMFVLIFAFLVYAAAIRPIKLVHQDTIVY